MNATRKNWNRIHLIELDQLLLGSNLSGWSKFTRNKLKLLIYLMSI